MTTKTPETKCLRCGRKLDAATHPTDDIAPSPGDVTICLYCGYMMAFAGDMTVRELTEEELKEVPLDEVARIQQARRRIRDPE